MLEVTLVCRLAYSGDVVAFKMERLEKQPTDPASAGRSCHYIRDDTLIFGMLFGQLVDQIHGFQCVCCDPLQPSFGVFQGGYVPLGFAPSVDVTQSGSNVTQEGIKFACSHKQIIRVIAQSHQVFSRAPRNHLR
jgi:hypothetical protein